MNEQKIKNVFADEEFVVSIMNMETAEEVQAALAEKEIEISVEEIEAIREKLISKDGELSEEDLEDVSGGVVITATVTGILCAIFGGISAAAGTGTFVHNVTRGRW